MHDSAVLLLNHYLDSEVAGLYEDLKRDCRGRRDVWLLSDRTQVGSYFRRLPTDTRQLKFTTSDLTQLGYPGKSHQVARRTGQRNMNLGNAELPVLLFYRCFPNYKHYWVVEYDVRFTGDWEKLLSSFDASHADLLGTTLHRRRACPQWSHWNSIQAAPLADVPEDRWIRGFFPIYRISSRALTALDTSYTAGCAGHMEGLMPTILDNHGLEIEDIGGEGEFVRVGNKHRYYTNQPGTGPLSPGTFVYRPIMSAPGSTADTLWHPVKKETVNGVHRMVERALSRAGTYVRDSINLLQPNR